MRRRQEFPWHVVFGIVIVCFMVFGIFYYVHSKSECDAKHGVLVRDALGWYACVDTGGR